MYFFKLKNFKESATKKKIKIKNSKLYKKKQNNKGL